MEILDSKILRSLHYTILPAKYYPFPPQLNAICPEALPTPFIFISDLSLSQAYLT